MNSLFAAICQLVSPCFGRRTLPFVLFAFLSLTLQGQGYKDVTRTYIKNADQRAATGWTYTRQTVAGETKTWSQTNKSYSGSYDSEIYAGETLNYTTFSATQTITLPRGSYHLVGKAFQRDVPDVVLFAETDGQRTTTPVASVYGQFSSSSGDKSPSSMETAAKAFNGNMYLNDLAFSVESDEAEVTIGYSGEFTAARQWFIFGAMTLYAIQEEVSQSYPIDITPTLDRSRTAYTGLTGRYEKANVYIHEKYSESNFEAGDLVSQTFAGLDNGIYEVVIQAAISKANGVGSLPSKRPQVFAGSVTSLMTAKEQSSVSTLSTFRLLRVPVTDGTLRVGCYNQSEGCNWLLFNVQSVKYCGQDLSTLVTTYEKLLKTAKSLQGTAMQASLSAALDQALVAAETDVDTESQAWLEATINILSQAVEAAQSSHSLYEGAILTAVTTLKAQSAVESVAAALQEGYDNGTFASVEEVRSTYQQLEIKALGREPATDYTSVIINPGFEAGTIDGWDIQREGEDTGVYFTTSTTYGFSSTQGRYLFNTWSSDIRTLDVGQTIHGLPNGYYTLSVVVAGYGDLSPISLTANDALASVRPSNAEDVEAETSVGHPLTLPDILVSDGTLHFRLQNTGKGKTLLKADCFQLIYDRPYQGPDSYQNLSLEVNLENSAVAAFLAENTYTETTPSAVANYTTDEAARYDQPATLCIPLPLQTSAAELSITCGENLVSTCTIAAGTELFEVRNLVPQQTYSYVVTAEGAAVASGTITTKGRLRMIKADGIANMRDMGGWTNSDGHRLRYGRLYRGSELRAGKNYTASDPDLLMLQELGIAAEVDFREDVDFAGQQTQSAIDGATYYYANLSQWGEDALNLQTAKFRRAFDLVLAALRSGKAAYFHCIFGADRTGCFALLLEGLLGLPVDQLCKDYELTSFSSAGARPKEGIEHKLQYIQSLPGTSLQEQFYNYWRGAVDVSEEDLNAFINLMVEGESPITTAPHAELPTPAIADGNYYLYAPQLQQFLGRGLNFGTRLVADNYGVPVAITTNGIGVSTLRFLDNNLYLGSDGYSDKLPSYNTASWILEPKADGFVLKTIYGNYLQLYSDESGTRARLEGTTAADATTVVVKSAAQQKALVAAAHNQNVQAAAEAAGIIFEEGFSTTAFEQLLADDYKALTRTSCIKYARTGSTAGWRLSEPYGHGEQDNAYNVGNYGGDLYLKNGNVSQLISPPRAGLYKLTLNAFYRQGPIATCYNLGQAGYDNLSNAYVSFSPTDADTINTELSTYYAQIPSWYSYHASNVNPNTTDEAKALMDAGKYEVEVYAYIGEAQKAVITIHVPNFIPMGWCIFNNFTLTEYIPMDEYIGVSDLEDGTSGSVRPVYNLSGQRLHQPR
ncbi:MAG: tyrosine-protein phosphatase, partial [Bacteroidaceae bacterium]|nr:tyrosine-protein phosphatase [Bacteroidaceae bacterium]